MSFLYSWLFGSKPKAPERVPTDTIIPVHTHDDNAVFRAVGMRFTMRFDDVLDVDKLVGALEKLLLKPGWKRLGARLRLDVSSLTFIEQSIVFSRNNDTDQKI